MIKLTISGVGQKINEQEKEYIEEKIGQLDHLLPASAKASVSGKVVLKKQNKKSTAETICEVSLSVPKKPPLFAKGQAKTSLAAIDAVEDRLARQIRKYKTDKDKTRARGLIRRFWRRLRPGDRL